MSAETEYCRSFIISARQNTVPQPICDNSGWLRLTPVDFGLSGSPLR
jgi:hypothetical protein